MADRMTRLRWWLLRPDAGEGHADGLEALTALCFAVALFSLWWPT